MFVEMDKSRKPIVSCAMPAAEGKNIKLIRWLKKQERVMDFLANHPLDCPVCDHGGECDLQDQSLYYGADKSRFSENKRYVSEMGPINPNDQMYSLYQVWEICYRSCRCTRDRRNR